MCPYRKAGSVAGLTASPATTRKAESVSPTPPEQKSGGVLYLSVVQGRNLNNGEDNVSPLCVVEFDQHQIHTKAGQGCNPTWNDDLKFDVANRVDATIWIYSGNSKACAFQ